jgi:glutaredoxin 3
MSQPKVIIYTKDYCPYCKHAKRLLESKGVSFEERDLEDKPEEFAALMKKTGLRTVPQIFVGEQLIGGYSDMAALDREGKLDPLLNLPS